MTFAHVSLEVQAAIDGGDPIVALESTLIAHGLPYPENLAVAQQLEEIIRSEGALPATVAIIGGRIKIGLSADELRLIATAPHVHKASLMDIPVLVAGQKHGATTVSGTMFCAARAGIHFFATGGIGGVHRNANETFDISADLTALGQTQMTVVCSGAKAILDLSATLEYLEMLGVPVIGYGTKLFPAFYARHAGLELEHRVDSVEAAATIVHARRELGMTGGIIVANPVPAESALDRDEMEEIIQAALEEAETRHVKGKALTPFLLASLQTKTQGRSLTANIALLKSNARLAAQIAKAYARDVAIDGSGNRH